MIVQIGLLSSVASMPSLCMKKHLGALQPAILGALPDMSKEQSLELLELYIAGWALQLLSLPPSHAHGTATSLVNFFMTVDQPWHDWTPQWLSVFCCSGGFVRPAICHHGGHPHHQVLGNPSCAGHFLQHLLLHGHNLGQPKLLALRNLPQNAPVIFADWHVLFHPSILLVVLMNVSLNILPY